MVARQQAGCVRELYARAGGKPDGSSECVRSGDDGQRGGRRRRGANQVIGAKISTTRIGGERLRRGAGATVNPARWRGRIGGGGEWSSHAGSRGSGERTAIAVRVS